MRLTALLREIARDLATGSVRATLMAAVLALTGALAGIAEVDAGISVGAAAAAYRSAGAAVLRLDAPGLVDARACDALAGTGSIVAAGATREADPLVTSVLPHNPVPVTEFSPGMSAVLAGPAYQATTQGVGGGYAAADLAALVGAAPGSTFPGVAPPITLTGTYLAPDDGRQAFLGYTLALPAPAGAPFDACWVEAWPADETVKSLLMSVAQPGADTKVAPVASQLNATLGTTFGGAGAFGTRPTWWLGWVMVAVGGALGYVEVRSRRLQLATARHLGLALADQVTHTLAVTAVWALVGGLAAAAAVLVAAHHAPATDWGAVALLGLRPVIAGSAATLAGALVGVFTTRERHLFRYFAAR